MIGCEWKVQDLRLGRSFIFISILTLPKDAFLKIRECPELHWVMPILELQLNSQKSEHTEEYE